MSNQKADNLYQKIVINEFHQQVGLPIKEIKNIEFNSTILIGHSVKLIQVDPDRIKEDQVDQLWEVVQSEPCNKCWTYLPYTGFFSKQNLVDALKTQFGFSDSFHYLIEVDLRIVGWVAVLNIRPSHRVIEIGNVYFSHQMKQSTAATETIYLLLKESIKQNFRRIEWKCDDLNQPSKQAALRFGFQLEGVFRQDRITKGRNRNTAWYSILDEEWIRLKPAYEAWLDRGNFDEVGRQKIRLQDFIALYL